MIAAMVAAAAVAAAAPLPQGQLHYSQSCGGCHGLLGQSAKSEIPELRDRVGYFLCSRGGRDYLVRLPNVAFAAMDDATLAAALNFMLFGLGGDSVPAAKALARPFTAPEVHRLRLLPLKARDLAALRAAAFATADPSCFARLTARPMTSTER